MPVSNENNENEVKKAAAPARRREGAAAENAGGQAAPRKKLNVVFRKQNSTSIKELPKRLKSAADGSTERRQKPAENVAAAAAGSKRPRPLPAGTKPVKPAVYGAPKTAGASAAKKAVQKAEIRPDESVRDTAADQAAELKAAELRAAEEMQAAAAEAAEAARARTEAQAEARTEAAAPVTEVTEPSAPVPAEPAGEPYVDAKEESQGSDVPEKTEEKADAKTEKKPASKAASGAARTGAAPARSDAGDGKPKVRIVKSYANYDAAAVIAEASRQARKNVASQRGTEGPAPGQRRPRTPGDGTGRPAGRNAGAPGTRREGQGQPGGARRPGEGGRTFIARGSAAPGGRAAAPGGRAGAPAPAFSAAQGKSAGGRGGRNAYAGKDKKDRKDKYVDELAAGKTARTGKGAFIRPEPKKEKPEEEIKVIVIPEKLTIKDLADKLHMLPSVIVKKLFLQGKMVTPNTDLSYEEAEEIAMEYDILCEKEEVVDVIAEILREDEEDEEKMITRNPVVCVMGHVDHGKTSLLDAIRNTNVTAREAGGITQHIGASVVRAGDRDITFLDTPGHEAFTAMRLRGAQSTDIAVLVVAADDGVKPQTIEAINHAKSAGVEVVVAINKVDKPAANIDMVKQELTEYGLIAEEWGGSTPMVPVSAKTGQGISDLLDMILLVADVLELKANPNRNARGLVIEAQLDKGRGPVATVLVQKGTLKVGDNVAAGACYGKVRAMMDDKGGRLRKAGPSVPAEILGLNDVPNAGEVFMVCDDEKEARSIAETFIAEQKKHKLEETMQKMNLDQLFDQIKAGNVKELPIIVKADVQGSVEAVKQSLGKLSNEEVAVKVIHAAVGNINESDVNLASAANAIIIGFNVKPDPTAKSTAEREKVDVRLYRVIYQAIEDLEAALTGMLAPVYEEKMTGRAIVRQLFKASGVGTIAGCYVTDGVIEKGSRARVFRGDKQVFDGDIASLKRFKDEVKEVRLGFECGIVLDGFSEVQVDDNLEIYKMVQVLRTSSNAN